MKTPQNLAAFAVSVFLPSNEKTSRNLFFKNHVSPPPILYPPILTPRHDRNNTTMGECTVTWGLAGDQDSLEVARGTGSSISSTELLDDIQKKVAPGKNVVAIVRDVEGKQVVEGLQIPGGTHLSVQRISKQMHEEIARYMSLDSLLEPAPRVLPNTYAMEVDQGDVQQGSLPPAGQFQQYHEPQAPDVSMVPPELLCPVTRNLLTDAVALTCCNNTISKSCFLPGQPCPVCGATTSIAPPDKRVRRLAQKYLPVQVWNNTPTKKQQKTTTTTAK